jgi:heterodisulfide reductase subunit C2
MEIVMKEPNAAMAEKIQKLSGENYYKCYQCGECTSGCPAADRMDILPNQINMLLQTGDFETVLNSKTIWVCVACFECGTRCPKKVDISKINEALRQINIRANMDLYNIWEVAGSGEFPTVALVAAFRKFTA